MSFFERDAFDEHECLKLELVVPRHEFDWVVLMPGLLHIEMNISKPFFSLNWSIVLCEVVKLLAFKSEKSLMYARNCSDHHKTWQILEIMYIAIADELLVPYVRHARENGQQTSVESYWKWNEDICNSNYIYMQQIVFTFLHSMMLFRSGVRNLDSLAAESGKRKLGKLFYTRNHPRYHRIMVLDKLCRTLMPDEIKHISDYSFSTSRNNRRGHYQGGDVCLEEINKNGKSWVTQHGVSSNEEWLKVFRNLDQLNEVRTYKLL